MGKIMEIFFMGKSWETAALFIEVKKLGNFPASHV